MSQPLNPTESMKRSKQRSWMHRKLLLARLISSTARASSAVDDMLAFMAQAAAKPRPADELAQILRDAKRERGGRPHDFRLDED